MIVRIRNLDIFERSVPTPVNTSIPIRGNQTIEFEYPKAFDGFFYNLAKFNFAVECITQLGDIRPNNPDLDFSEIDPLIRECLSLISETQVCNDGGIHVLPDEMWVDEGTYETFMASYERAISAKQTAMDQSDIDGAVAELKAAKEAFEAAREPGIGTDESLPHVCQYGFGDDGLVLGPMLGLGDVRDNSFFLKLDSPLDDETELVASLEIDEHRFDTHVSVERHPELANRSVTTVGETIVWSLGTSADDTDIDSVDDADPSLYSSEWPTLPNEALMTVKTSDGETLRGADERNFEDKPVTMARGKVDNHVVTALNFRYLDQAVKDANESKAGVLTSELDGDDVLPEAKWVTPQELSAFDEAISKAESLKGVTENQQEINDALAALETATALFESKKRDGRKGPFIHTAIATPDAADSEGTKFYGSGFDVALKESSIIVRGQLNFIESNSEPPAKETHYYVPLTLTMDEGRVLVVAGMEDASTEVSHQVIGEGTVEVQLPVDADHRELTLRVCRNRDAYDTQSTEWTQTYTVNCSGVTFASELPYITGVSVPEGMYEERMFSELFDGELQLRNGKISTIDGATSLYIDSWPSAYGKEDVHWFVPARLEGLKPSMVVKCFTREDPSKELKHYTVGDDDILVTAISPTVKARRIVVYRNEENYRRDERGQEFSLDFSNVKLAADPNPLKGISLMTEGGWKGRQYSELVAEEPPFTVELDGNTVRCTGSLMWLDWPEVVGTSSDIHHFLPVRLDLRDGLVMSWFMSTSSPTETRHFTVDADNRDMVLQLSPGAPRKRMVVYTSIEAHNAQRDGVEYVIDCSEVEFQPKPFQILPVEDESGLKDAMDAEPDYDGNVHIELKSDMELGEELVIENPVVITGGEDGPTITADNGITVLADTVLDGLSIESKAPTGIVVGDATHEPSVEMDDVTFTFSPEKADADGKARGIEIRTAAYSYPDVTMKGCEVTVGPVPGGSVRGIEISSDSSVNGGGSLTLDGTTVTASGSGTTGIALNAPHAELTVENGSTVTNRDYEGILIGYDGKVTVDASKVEAVTAIYVDSIAGCDTANAVVEIVNGSDVVSANSWAPKGANNTAAIVLANCDNCTVHLDATSSIEAVGGNTSHNNEYIGAFHSGNDNTIFLEGAVTSRNNINGFWFTHSSEDSDGLYYDADGKGDNLIVTGTAAAKAYVIDRGVPAMLTRSVPKSNTVNVTNDLKTAVTVATKAQAGEPSNDMTITMGRFAADSGNDDVTMPEGVTFIGYSEYVRLQQLSGDLFGDKRAIDLQYGVNILENGFTAQVTGNLKYVKWEGFSDSPRFQRGHYLALSIVPNPGTNDILVSNGYTGTVDKSVGIDGKVVLYIGTGESRDITFKALTNEGEKVIRLDTSGLVLEPNPNLKATDLFTVEAATGTVLSKDMKDVQTGVTATTDGMKVSLGGTLHWLDSWTQFSKSAKGNFVGLHFTPAEGVTKLVQSNSKGDRVELDGDGLLVLQIVGDSPFTVTATDFEGDHDVTFDVTGLTREPEPVKLFEVSVPSGETPVGNKTVADLQSDIAIKDGAVTGTVRQFKGLILNDKTIDNTYLALDVRNESTNLDKVTVAFKNDSMTLAIVKGPGDMVLIPYLKSMETAKLEVTQKRGSKVWFSESYDLSKLVREPLPLEKVITLTLPEPDDEIGNKRFSDLAQNVEVRDGKVTGDLKWVPDLTFTEGKSMKGCYLPFKVSPTKVDGATVKTVLKNSKMNLAYVETGVEGLYLVKGLKSMDGMTLTVTQTNTTSDKATFTETLDLSALTVEESPEVSLTITKGKTYDIEDASVLGTYKVSNGKITGESAKYAGCIMGYVNQPQKQSGHYISVTAKPWEGVESSKDGSAWFPMKDNGKVLIYLGAEENEVPEVQFKNTNRDGYITKFDLSGITFTPDDTIPDVESIGYKATKDELDAYLSELGLDGDSNNVSDQIFYIHYSKGLDDTTDYVTFVEVNGHTYGVGHTHVEKEETVTYFSMKNGYQVDYVDGAVKTKENASCDLTEYSGDAKVSLYRVDGQLDLGTYPENMTLIAETAVKVK